jgi:hypothetical protein
VLVLDDGDVDAMAGEKRGHAAAAGIHHHNFYMRLLFEQRLDRVNCLVRRAEGNHDCGQARRPRLQGIRPLRNRDPERLRPSPRREPPQRSAIAQDAYAEG